jgi:hypothetical protein
MENHHKDEKKITYIINHKQYDVYSKHKHLISQKIYNLNSISEINLYWQFLNNNMLVELFSKIFCDKNLIKSLIEYLNNNYESEEKWNKYKINFDLAGMNILHEFLVALNKLTFYINKNNGSVDFYEYKKLHLTILSKISCPNFLYGIKILSQIIRYEHFMKQYDTRFFSEGNRISLDKFLVSRMKFYEKKMNKSTIFVNLTSPW